MPKKKSEISLSDLISDMTPLVLSDLIIEQRLMKQHIYRLGTAIWMVVIAFAMFAISIMLLVYGNPSLV